MSWLGISGGTGTNNRDERYQRPITASRMHGFLAKIMRYGQNKAVMAKRALVLCGGGALGAYEVGVWQYLREKKIKFDIVTGTSIGALLGALVAADDYEGALKIWKNITPEKVATDGINIYSNVFETLQKASPDKFWGLLFSYIRNHGADIEPFKHVVSEVIDPKAVKKSKMRFGIVTTEYPSRKEVDVIVNDLNEDKIIPFLHASSACWPAFPICKIDGKKYIDGGYNNNLPIDFALKLGATEVVAVMLPSIPKMPQHPELMEAPFVKTIRPNRDLGSILDFSHETIMKNMKLGYLDAKKAYGESVGFKYAFKQSKNFKQNSDDFVLGVFTKYISESNGLFKALQSDEHKSSSAIEMHAQALELMGEWAGMDETKDYSVGAYLKELFKLLDEASKDGKRISSIAAQSDHNRVLQPKDKLPYLAYIYDSLKKGQDAEKAKCYFKKSPESIWAYEALRFHMKKDAVE